MSEKSPKSLKVLAWFVCSVLLALYPVGFNFIHAGDKGQTPSWVDLLKGGELFLIAAALAADAIGRAMLGGAKFRAVRLMSAFGCLLVLIAASGYFGDLAYRQMERDTTIEQELANPASDLASKAYKLDTLRTAWTKNSSSPRNIADTSLVLFGVSLVAALGVILVEED